MNETEKDMHWVPMSRDGKVSMELVPLTDYEIEKTRNNKKYNKNRSEAK